MRAEVTAGEDSTTLYLRWEIVPELGEIPRLKALGGPLVLRVPARHFVDLDGSRHETFDVEIPIWPHAGDRNRGQAKFTDYEARRAFWERLEGAVVGPVTRAVFETPPGSVPVEGLVVRAA
jgi:hypothetical protein